MRHSCSYFFTLCQSRILPSGTQIQIPCIPVEVCILYLSYQGCKVTVTVRSTVSVHAAMHAPEKSSTACLLVNACASQSWASETCYVRPLFAIVNIDEDQQQTESDNNNNALSPPIPRNFVHNRSYLIVASMH
jgi:hypothetical protein